MSWTWRGTGFLCHKRDTRQEEADARLRLSKSQKRLQEKRRMDQAAYVSERQAKRNEKTGYRTSLQIKNDENDPILRIRNRIYNIQQQNVDSIVKDYLDIINRRATNNSSPIVWMNFTEYYRASMSELLEQRGLGDYVDETWVKKYIDDLHMQYRSKVEREIQEIKKRKADELKRAAMNSPTGKQADSRQHRW